MAYICAHSCNSWPTEERPYHCRLPGLHKEKNNLTEKDQGLNWYTIQLWWILTRGFWLIKPLKGVTSVALLCISINESVECHHYQIKMKPHHIMQATKIACVWYKVSRKMLWQKFPRWSVFTCLAWGCRIISDIIML